MSVGMEHLVVTPVIARCDRMMQPLVMLSALPSLPAGVLCAHRSQTNAAAADT